jgi:Putative auto-transporter adhesin, head GIN domain
MVKKPSNKMKKHKYNFLLFFLIVLIGWTGCKKSGVNCLTSNGKTIRQDRLVQDFDSIDVQDYVNLILSQDSMNKVTVESGQNIINGITTEVVDRQLVIRNANKCNWLRSYDVPVNVYVSVKDLKKIYYLSSGNISTTNTLKSYSLIIEVWGGSGIIDLDMDVFEGYFALVMGTADFNLHGHCAINTIYSGDFGLFQCKNLKTGYSFVTNKSSNDCYVNASQFLQANINSIGNIYYTGNPDSLAINIHGAGSVIPF